MENEKKPLTLAEVLKLSSEHAAHRNKLPGPWSSEDMLVELLGEILIQLTALRELAAHVNSTAPTATPVVDGSPTVSEVPAVNG